MEREKREIKTPSRYEIPKICYPRIRKKQKKKPTQVAEYQPIPFPLKFIYTRTTFALYGDLGLKETDGRLVTETVLLNSIVNCRGISLIQHEKTNLVSMLLEKKMDIQIPSWQTMVEKLKNSQSAEIRSWGDRVKDFSIRHENLYRALASEEVVIHGMKEEALIQATQENDKKIMKLFQTYPCVQFGVSHEKGTSSLGEVLMNEEFLNVMGHSLDSFSSTIFSEGIPQMTPIDMVRSTKSVVDTALTVGESPEIISEILMKNGYTKKIRFKFYFFFSYHNRVYMNKNVMVILGKESDEASEAPVDCQINKNFLRQIIKKEKEMNKFLKKHYGTSVNLPYESMNRTCKIRNIDFEEIKQESPIK